MKKLLAILVLTSATLLFFSANRSGEVYASSSEPAAAPTAVYELSDDGEASSDQGYLGIQVNRLSGSLRDHFGVPDDLGVLVAEVEPGTPAEAAGLRAGDVVTGLGGEPIVTPGELTREILVRPGEWVEIEIYRDGSPMVLSATLGQRQAMLEWDGDMAELEEIGQRIAEAFEGVDWTGFASQFEEQFEGQFEGQAEEWEQWGEELGARLSESMESQDWESWGQFWEDFGEDWGEWGEQFGEHWAEWGENQGDKWAEWGENQGEKWAEWGEQHGEKWAEWGEEQGEKWAEWGERFAETWEERGEEWGEMGEELAERLGESFESIDWDELGEMIERVVESVSRAVEDR